MTTVQNIWNGCIKFNKINCCCWATEPEAMLLVTHYVVCEPKVFIWLQLSLSSILLATLVRLMGRSESGASRFHFPLYKGVIFVALHMSGIAHWYNNWWNTIHKGSANTEANRSKKTRDIPSGPGAEWPWLRSIFSTSPALKLMLSNTMSLLLQYWLSSSRWILSNFGCWKIFGELCRQAAHNIVSIG